MLNDLNFVDVSSSNVESVAYKEELSELYIKFKTGAVYCYFDVPAKIYNDLLTASSVGCMVNKKIKTNYNYERVV